MKQFIAWFLLALAAFEIVVGPFVIGKERKPVSALSYLISVAIWIAVIALVGIVLGWWMP